METRTFVHLKLIWLGASPPFSLSFSRSVGQGPLLKGAPASAFCSRGAAYGSPWETGGTAFHPARSGGCAWCRPRVTLRVLSASGGRLKNQIGEAGPLLFWLWGVLNHISPCCFVFRDFYAVVVAFVKDPLIACGFRSW